MSLRDLYRQYHEQVQFLSIYIREAHPKDGWWLGRGIIGKKEFGDRAEKAAVDYLKSKGYEIEATKWRQTRFELDIVARKDDCLVFIEVKASKRIILGPPEIRVGYEKRKRIAQAASEYISQLDTLPEEMRFDVIGITWGDGERPEINHISSAFTLDDI